MNYSIVDHLSNFQPQEEPKQNKESKFEVSQSHSFRDEKIEALLLKLMPFTRTQNLSLNFLGYEEISDAGIEKLSSAIKSFTSLQNLSLHFWDCSEISDVGIEKLSSGIKLLTGLQNLLLNFRRCSKISCVGQNIIARLNPNWKVLIK